MKINAKKQSLSPVDASGLTDCTRKTALHLAILAALYPSLCYPNPDGAQIVSGQVSIDSSTPGVTTVTNSPNAIINWQNFSIAQNELTRFIQQNGQSAVLNRIIGQNPSEILGQLASNGKVFLINPNGIVFGAGASIDTQGLIASSLNLSDQDFLNGNYHFMAGSNAGNILNEGIIRAGKDGNIILIAPKIENNGIIKSDGGSITLAAGQELTITNLDDPDIRFQIQAPADQVLNLGKLLTEGGVINVFANTIKHSGEINADSVEVDAQGKIRLVATQDITLAADSKISANNNAGDAGAIHVDSKTGTTLAQGSIAAEATQSGKGGDIELLGERVGVLDQAHLDASGKNGGGQVLIGGDYQGKNANVHNAKATYLGKDTTIKADAKNHGDGGKVIAWSDQTTRAHGNISAKGGETGGNGGFVETSGHNYLDVAGARVDTRAQKGATGNWLLDPTDITITPGAAASATFTASIFDNGAGASSSLTDGDISTALNGSNITIQTTSAYVGSPGDITFDSTTGPIQISETSAAARTLTLTADNNIVFTGANGTTFLTPISTGHLDVYFNVPTGKVMTNTGSSVTLDGSSTGLYGLTNAWLSAGRAWDNFGSLNITDNAAVHLGTASSFNNKSGAIANIAGTTGWAFWSSASDDGIINNDGTFSVTKSTAFEAAYNQASSGLLNVKDINLNLQNALSIAGGINLTPTGATTFSTLNVNEYHGTSATFTNTTIMGAGPAGSVLTVGGSVGTPTASFSGIYAPDVQLNIGGANPGNVSIVGNSLFKTVAYNSGTFALNNAALKINVGDYTIPSITTHTGNVGYVVRGNLNVNSAFTLPGNLDLVGGWNGTGYATSPGANTDIIIGSGGNLTTTGNIWMNAGTMITNNAALNASNITLRANKMALNTGSTINGSTAVSLLSTNPIDVAATTTGDALGTVELSSTELNTITSPVLRIGDSSSGAIDIKSVLAPAHISSTIKLTSSGAITQQVGATIAALPGLGLSGASVTLNEANPAGVVAGSATGDFKYRTSNLLTVSAVDGLSGISGANIELGSDATSGINQSAPISTSGTLALKTIGPVDLRDSTNSIALFAADLNAAGAGTGSLFVHSSSAMNVDGTYFGLSGISTKDKDIVLSMGAGSALTVSQPINAGIAKAVLEADTLALTTGTVTASEANLRPNTSGRAITVGSATCSASPCLTLTDLYKVSASSIGIGSIKADYASGPIHVAGITSGTSLVTDIAPTTTRIGLLSGAGVSQSGALTVQDLGINATGTVTLGSANSVTNLAAKTNGGNFTFNNTPNINITSMSGGTGLDSYSMSGIDTCLAGVCGTATLTSAGSILNSSATPITADTLTATAATGIAPLYTKVNTLNAANSTANDINIVNDSPTLTIGTASNGGGNVYVTNTGPITTSTTLAAAVNGSTTPVYSPVGSVTLTATGPLTVDTGGVSGSNITLTAVNGALLSVYGPLAATSNITLYGGSSSTVSGSTSYGGSYALIDNTPTSGGGGSTPPPDTLPPPPVVDPTPPPPVVDPTPPPPVIDPTPVPTPEPPPPPPPDETPAPSNGSTIFDSPEEEEIFEQETLPNSIEEVASVILGTSSQQQGPSLLLTEDSDSNNPSGSNENSTGDATDGPANEKKNSKQCK